MYSAGTPLNAIFRVHGDCDFNTHYSNSYQRYSKDIPQFFITDARTLSSIALCEKCPNTEIYLVRIRENKDQEKLRIWILFTQYCLQKMTLTTIIDTSGITNVEGQNFSVLSFSNNQQEIHEIFLGETLSMLKRL